MRCKIISGVQMFQTHRTIIERPLCQNAGVRTDANDSCGQGIGRTAEFVPTSN